MCIYIHQMYVKLAAVVTWLLRPNAFLHIVHSLLIQHCVCHGDGDITWVFSSTYREHIKYSSGFLAPTTGLLLSGDMYHWQICCMWTVVKKTVVNKINKTHYVCFRMMHKHPVSMVILSHWKMMFLMLTNLWRNRNVEGMLLARKLLIKIF